MNDLRISKAIALGVQAIVERHCGYVLHPDAVHLVHCDPFRWRVDGDGTWQMLDPEFVTDEEARILDFAAEQTGHMSKEMQDAAIAAALLEVKQ